ncbi:MAG: sensor histidine kinase [Bacteriovorax sp.]
MEKLHVLLIAYAFTLMANLIIGVIQYRSNRAKIHLNMIAIWVATLLILVCNTLISTVGPVAATLAATFFLFVTSMLHGNFFSQLAGTRFPKKLSLLVFGTGYLLLIIAFSAGIPVKSIIPFGILICVAPFYFSSYNVFKEKSKRPLTTPEMVFFMIQVGVTLLNLTWSPVGRSEQFLLIGFTISLALGQLDALIVPVVAHDALFKKRTNHLEKEIADRAQELSNAKEQLLEANKLASLGRMAGGLAHEINNPLSLIRLQADLVEKRAQRNDISNQFLVDATEKIRLGVKRVADLTLALRRIAQDEKASNLIHCEMDLLVKEAISFCDRRIKEDGIQVILDVPEEKAMVNVNRLEMSQAIIHLLSNALDAVENLPQKLIRVTLLVKQSFVQITVEDSGKISAENIDRLMEPFFTTKPVGKGVGLGLAISKSIIEGHQGKFFIDRSSEFTRFVVLIPKSDKMKETVNPRSSVALE